MNIAHGFALAQIEPAQRADLLQAMGELGITMTTVAPLRLPQLPLHELDASGVRFGFGTDGIRDLWSPYGTGDLLGIAWQYARASSLVRDEDLARVVEVATGSAAPFVGGAAADLTVGARADIVLVDAENPMDALVRTSGASPRGGRRTRAARGLTRPGRARAGESAGGAAGEQLAHVRLDLRVVDDAPHP